jgi:putative transposase
VTTNPSQQPFHRHSIRLPDYDYSEEGSYFVTLLTHGREQIFGKVINGEVNLTPAGWIVWKVLKALPERYPQIELDSAIVMPNHFHAIITINYVDDRGISKVSDSDVRAIHELPLRQSTEVKEILEEKNQKEIRKINRRRMLLPKVVGYFKMQTGKQINIIRNTPGQPVWHRNYYEHIILTDKEFESISDYIEFNPTNWESKDEYS